MSGMEKKGDSGHHREAGDSNLQTPSTSPSPPFSPSSSPNQDGKASQNTGSGKNYQRARRTMNQTHENATPNQTGQASRHTLPPPNQKNTSNGTVGTHTNLLTCCCTCCSFNNSCNIGNSKYHSSSNSSSCNSCCCNRGCDKSCATSTSRYNNSCGNKIHTVSVSNVLKNSSINDVNGGDRLVDSNKSSKGKCEFCIRRSVSSPTEKLAFSTLRVASGVTVSYSTDTTGIAKPHSKHHRRVWNYPCLDIGGHQQQQQQQQQSRGDNDSCNNNNNDSNNSYNNNHNNPFDEVFPTTPEFPKLAPLSKLISAQAISLSSLSSSSSTSSPSSSSSSSTASISPTPSSTSPSSTRLPLLWRRRRAKQNTATQNGSGVASSFLPHQSRIIEEDEQQQQQQHRRHNHPYALEKQQSTVDRIFLRAAADLHSWDKRKVKKAKLMLKRLVHVGGFQVRAKAMSYPATSPIPVITVTDLTYGDTPEATPPPPKKEHSSWHGGRRDAEPIRRRRTASSVPNLFDSYIASTFLPSDELDTDIGKRKDSVSRIRKKSLVVAHKRRLSNASCGAPQQVTLPLYLNRRSSSICDSVTSRGTPSPVQDHPVSWKEDAKLLTWSNLLASIPPEDRKSTHIRRHQILLPVPVCLVGKEKPLSFTSLEVIEQALRRLHPDVIVKKRKSSRPEGDWDDTGETEDQISDEKPDIKQLNTRRLSSQVLTNRRVSIVTCINSMQSGLDDYDKQLSGVKSVGTYAEEEELKVLIAKPDAIGCVINAMNSYPEKEELQLNACLSLLKMASVSESNCVHILQHDGLTPICNTLRLHSDNTDIVRPLLSTIAFISTAPDLVTALVTAGVHSEVLRAMAIHGQDADVVRESCYIVGNLLISVDIVQQLMYSAAVHTIINLVQNFPEDASILENACRTLGSFAIFDETCQDVANAGATSAVLTSVTSPAANAGVIECGCWALASLTATVPTCEEVVQLGGVKVILQVLTDYPKEEGLQDYGIRVLCNLSQKDETTLSVCTEQVYALLYNAMTYFSESVELLEIICITLCQIFTNNETLCQCIVDTLFVRDLVKLMMELSDNQQIQEHGCKMLGNLAVEDDLRRLAESQGASRAIISAMLTNNTDGNIQEVGCMAIMNLTADNKENKVRIKNAGVVSALLISLQEFQHDATIVLSALKALGNLISLEEVCHLLLDEKGLVVLISLTDIYEDDQELLVFLTMVICGICELPDLKEEEVDEIDDALTRITAFNQYCEAIAQHVCQAMEKLLQTPHGRDTFMRKNRLSSILSTMHRFPANVDIHRTCCKLVAVVSFYIDSKKRLITETTMKSVLKSMELFPFDVELQIIACGTISCMVQKIAILKHELIGHGGIGLLRTAVLNHQKESRLAVMSLITLENVLPIDSSMYPSESRVALELILMCMKNFPENEEVQLVGCHGLSQCQIRELNDTQNLSDIIIQALRRHGEDPEMQRKSAQALKNASCDKSSSIIQKTLNSPKLFVTEEFWKIWESK